MTGRVQSTRSSLLLLIGILLLVTGALLPLRADSRAPLEADILAHSRGGNNGKPPVNAACNTINGIFACAALNNNCVSCSVLAVQNQGAAGGGNVVGTMGFNNCGNEFAGKCNAALQCVTVGNPVRACVGISLITQP